MHRPSKFLSHLLPLAIAVGLLASLPVAANPEFDLPYGGQTVLTRSNSGRTLYDRNKALRNYQRQRGEMCRCYCDENGNYYCESGGPDLTYWAPGYHPDAAGNEDR